MEIRASTVLPARRDRITLRTADGLSLVGEVALPLDREPVATLLGLHPLPTHGGMMDSHLFRKASYRLPALADLAVAGGGAAAVAGGLVVWHRTSAPVGERPGGGGRDPDIPAATPGR